MSMYAMGVTQPKKMLNNLASWLKQAKAFAEQREYDPDTLLSFKLTPDQFALGRQVQVTCDTAKLTAARLTGKDAPSHPDDETTIDALIARIASTVEFLDSLSASDFDSAAERLVPLRFAPDKGARGAEYFMSFGLPNFYFHITTVYALLRVAGLPLGKRAFLGSMEMEDLPQ